MNLVRSSFHPSNVAPLRGFAAGTAATVAMSTAMVLLQRAGAMGQMPPQVITDHGLTKAGAFDAKSPAARRPMRRGLATLLHFAFGGAAGMVFESVRARVAPRVSPPVLYGSAAAFGALLWVVSYAGWVPALGIMPRPQHDRPGRPTSMVLAHLVWGAALAGGLRRRAR